MRKWTFAKGHGTQNDFVILLDRTGMVDPDPQAVRFLCDRHAGLGGDGILRAVPARHIPEWDGPDDVWFMDYRNADGSIAEMCGNGIRVFARYLADRDLAQGPDLRIGTRAGLKQVHLHADGRITVEMGTVRVDAGDIPVTVGRPEHGGVRLTGQAADVGNPHLVAHVDSADELARLDLHCPPRWPEDRFPDGVNVEAIEVPEPGRLAMRVYERGVGETRSCGTGTVAAAAVASTRGAAPTGADGRERWTVQVPGGRVEVTLGEAADEAGGGEGGRPAWLTGPAVIVAHGEVQIPHRG